MNSFRGFLALPFLALGSAAQAAPDPQLPDRPAAAIAKYKDNMLPIVDVQGSYPMVVEDGNQVALDRDAGIVLSLGERYADGFVTISDVTQTDVQMASNEIDRDVGASLGAGEKAGPVAFEANLTADRDVWDAYALLVSLRPDQGPDKPPMLAVVAQQIGNLSAGKQKHLSVRLPGLSGEARPVWGVLVFSAGRQVRSTGMGEILPVYFDRLENSLLKRLIAQRVTRGVDAPIAAYRQMPLGLPDAVAARYRGTTVKVEVRVGADGRVVYARPLEVSDPELSSALSRGLATWLFVPPVKGGAVAPASAIIPLRM
jgi:hypothetical protein